MREHDNENSFRAYSGIKSRDRLTWEAVHAWCGPYPDSCPSPAFCPWDTEPGSVAREQQYNLYLMRVPERLADDAVSAPIITSTGCFRRAILVHDTVHAVPVGIESTMSASVRDVLATGQAEAVPRHAAPVVDFYIMLDEMRGD